MLSCLPALLSKQEACLCATCPAPPASCRNAGEIRELAGCDNITIAPALLKVGRRGLRGLCRDVGGVGCAEGVRVPPAHVLYPCTFWRATSRRSCCAGLGAQIHVGSSGAASVLAWNEETGDWSPHGNGPTALPTNSILCPPALPVIPSSRSWSSRASRCPTSSGPTWAAAPTRTTPWAPTSTSSLSRCTTRTGALCALCTLRVATGAGQGARGALRARCRVRSEEGVGRAREPLCRSCPAVQEPLCSSR